MIVKEAKPRDTGRGIARIDTTLFEKYHIKTGDIVTIQGKKKTACVAWPSYPDDQGEGYIRIDGITRKNADVGIGDKITIFLYLLLTPNYELTEIKLSTLNQII